MIFIRSILLVLFFFPAFFSAQSDFVCKRAEALYKISNSKYPGDENIDVKYYELNLEIKPSQKLLLGSVKIAFIITKSGVDNISLDFDDNMHVDSVTANFNIDESLHNFDKIFINKTEPFDTGKKYEVVVSYHGTPVRTGFGGFVFDYHNGIPWVWTLSEPFASSTWWVCNDNPSDKADSAKIIITVPQDIFPVSNGKLISDELIKLGRRTVTWKTNYPISNYLISITAYDFDVIREYIELNATDTLEFSNYVLDSTVINYTPYIEMTKDILQYFSNIFGEYPFAKEKYGHVEFGYGGGMEHQTITSLGSWGEGIIAHELAHQWFGDKITCANWHEIWLNEGFAQYSESLYREHISGFEAYLDRIKNDMNRALSAQGSVYAEDISGIPSIFDLSRTYSKGAVVLHMLRGVVGDSTFFNILKSYATNPKLSYSSATTEDFKNIAESVYGNDLDWFFNEWIYGTKFPDYDYSYNLSYKGGKTIASVRVIQYPVGENKNLFVMPVQLRFTDGNRDTVVTAMIDKELNEFEYVFDFKVNEMIFDPNDYVLKRSGEIPWENNSNENFVLRQNYPNPFDERTAITFYLGRQSKIKLEVFNSLGQKIYSLADEELSPGFYIKYFDVNKLKTKLSSGVFIYRLIANGMTFAKKMVYIK